MFKVQSLFEFPNFRDEYENLINSYFPKGHQTKDKNISTRQEFCPLLEDSNLKNILFIQQDSKIVATLAWKPFEFIINNTKIKVAALGLVVTHPSYRAQGLSSLLMKYAENSASNESCSMMFLWSDLVDHYHSRGYLLLGGEVHYKLDSTTPNLIANSKLKLFKNFDSSKAIQIYQSMNIGPIRESKLFDYFISLPHTTTLQTENAYLLAGKARDLNNVIHEIAGDSKDYPTLFSNFLHQSQSENSTQLQIPHSHPHRLQIEKFLGKGDQVPWVFSKILNTKSVLNLLVPALNKHGLSLTSSSHKWQLSQSSEVLFESYDIGHLLQIFWSPWPISQIEELDDRVKTALLDWQTPSLYFWGLDSV